MTARRLAAAVVVGSTVFGLACSERDAEIERFPTGPHGPAGPEPTSQIAGAPAAWLGGSISGAAYEFGRDTGVYRSGSASAYLRSRLATTPENTFIALAQGFRSDEIRGKRVRLSGYLRASGVTGVGLGLWFRGDAASRTRAFDNMDGRRRTGTHDWTYAEIVVDIPDDVIGAYFGALLSGPGIGWVDDLRLEVVGSDVPVTTQIFDGPRTIADTLALKQSYARLGTAPLNLDFEGVTFPETEQTTVDWMRANTVSFSTDDPAASDADLEPLRQMVGNATIVALGEATHGTREFFRMKHRVFQYLVRNLGFDHFSIEASLPEALAVDHYVQTGVGDPATLVRGMRFWTWSTEEVYDLVRWMRTWNASGGQPRVRFSGFDMQYAQVAIDSLRAFGAVIGATDGDSVRAAYDCLGSIRALTSGSWITAYQQLSAPRQDACRTAFSGVDSLFVRRLTEWSAVHGEHRTALMQQLARLVSQWEDLARQTNSALSTAARDRAMAENVAWWQSRNGGAGMMLWAHNAHVRRTRPMMGSELDAKFGARYVSVGLTFSSGSFYAVMSNAQGVPTGGLQIHNIGGALPGSVEALFDATGGSRLLFDARTILNSGAPSNTLRHRLTMRFIGAAFAPTSPLGTWQGSASLPDDYDLLIWFRHATASRLSLAAGPSANQIASPE